MNENTYLLFSVEIAEKLGLNEAIFISLLHSKSESESKFIVDDTRWYYCTYNEWQELLPFWSRNTIIRTIKSLEKKQIVLAQILDEKSLDKTKYYTIDYERLNHYLKVGDSND